MLTNEIEMVVFDMAGTTVRDQSEVEHCFYQAAVETGLDADKDQIKAMQGLPKLEVVQTLWAEKMDSTSSTYQEKVQTTYDHFRHVLETHYQTAEVVPTEGALETFAWLRERNVKIVLTTGFYRKVANIILDRLGWNTGLDENFRAISSDAIIDLSLTPDETGAGRPHPAMILHAMKTFGITDPKRVVKIGDTPADLQAGAAAGVGLNLAVTNGTHTEEALKAYPHDALLSSTELLPEVISRYFQMHAAK